MTQRHLELQLPPFVSSQAQIPPALLSGDSSHNRAADNDSGNPLMNTFGFVTAHDLSVDSTGTAAGTSSSKLAQMLMSLYSIDSLAGGAPTASLPHSVRDAIAAASHNSNNSNIINITPQQLQQYRNNSRLARQRRRLAPPRPPQRAWRPLNNPSHYGVR
eukprot:GILJ01036180.1.p1 GENE.GILJ01036180.1~~GILJ01036180.1.p1  ORF type:complete len:180 (-),score=22.36 GILJ01036180.1:14-493(-)